MYEVPLTTILFFIIVILVLLLLKSKSEIDKLQEALFKMNRELMEVKSNISKIASEQAQKMFNDWKIRELQEPETNLAKFR